MPGNLSADLTLAPGEIKTLAIQIPPDYDFVVDLVTCRSDGPVLLKLGVSGPPGMSAPPASPSDALRHALQNEYPGHLAALVGESLDDWTSKNEILTERATGGDDDAFFELIGRDPRAIGSELAVGRLVSWRTELERYSSYYNLRESRLIPPTRLDWARARMEAAKKNLRRFGEVHIVAHDQRGKKPLPPAGVAKGLYYAFLCLFTGLKQEFTARIVGRAETARDEVLGIVRGLQTVPHSPDSFLVYVAWAARLLDELNIGDQKALTGENFLNWVGPYSQNPSETALELTALVFNVSPRTVERLKETDQIIPWAGPGGELYAIGGRPNYELCQFPEAQQVMRSTDRLK